MFNPPLAPKLTLLDDVLMVLEGADGSGSHKTPAGNKGWWHSNKEASYPQRQLKPFGSWCAHYYKRSLPTPDLYSSGRPGTHGDSVSDLQVLEFQARATMLSS